MVEVIAMKKSKEKVKGFVYLLHFSQPFKHANHYLGSAEDLESRLSEHAKGQGSRLIKIILEAGLTYSLVRTWKSEDCRNLKRHFKKKVKNSRLLCPLCNSNYDKVGNHETTT